MKSPGKRVQVEDEGLERPVEVRKMKKQWQKKENKNPEFCFQIRQLCQVCMGQTFWSCMVFALCKLWILFALLQ